MSDKITKSPQIRFAGFTDAWEQRKVGEFYNFKNGLNKEKEYFGRGVPIVNFTDVFHNRGLYANELNGKVDLSDKEITNFKVKQGDVFFTRTSETINEIGYPSVMLDSPINTVFSGFVLRGRAIAEDPLDNNFKRYVFFTNQFRKEMKKKSSMTTRALTSGTAIKEMYFEFPKSKKEQAKIGALFAILDHIFTLHQRNLELLIEKRKSLLSKMFPKDGANVPEIRFAGFTDVWEQGKFSEILKSHSFRAYLAEPSVAGNYEVIQQGDNPVLGYSNGEPFENFEGVTLFGDHTVSLYKPTEPFFVATDGVKILSGDGFDGMYLFSLLERYKPESQGYKRHFTILKNEDIWFTKNNDEQSEIGSFFANLANLITLHQHELNSLENLKKSLLQQMFI
ncbi:restriction endonuclease subunit S domain-containing protein [Bacillus safensis]|uniref:restriction endonuclease subunit S n=1 Tax=Bacillus safensis TaxID=561879 RepID=UPI0021C79539|nr:restriction endonuclease subunit S [Bacillus safensis]MCU0155919.1 restriction endonuclease subunit S [Bacillus safensis]